MSSEPSNEYQKLVEAVARALCERQIRRARKWDTQPERLEEMLPAAIDHAWQDRVDDARAALSALKLPHAGDDGWQDIATAPHACHVLAARLDACEWVYGVVLSPPSKPFTHWRPLPTPPAKGTPHV